MQFKVLEPNSNQILIRVKKELNPPLGAHGMPLEIRIHGRHIEVIVAQRSLSEESGGI